MFESRPWTSEAHYAYDDDLSLYFISRPSRRHSLEIKQNSNVSGTIVKEHTIGEKVRGVYFEGICELVENITELDAPFIAYRNRFNTNPLKLKEQGEEDGHRWYKISVSDFYIFDELEVRPAGKHHLKWL